MTRTQPFGLGYPPTFVDRFGLWLSSRQIKAAVLDFRQLRVADIGGYNVHFARTLLPLVLVTGIGGSGDRGGSQEGLPSPIAFIARSG